MTDVSRMEWKQFGVKIQGHIGFEQVQRTILRVTKKAAPTRKAFWVSQISCHHVPRRAITDNTHEQEQPKYQES